MRELWLKPHVLASFNPVIRNRHFRNGGFFIVKVAIVYE